eukprot:8159984-Pyramimonas_sp.AAC.1
MESPSSRSTWSPRSLPSPRAKPVRKTMGADGSGSVMTLRTGPVVLMGLSEGLLVGPTLRLCLPRERWFRALGPSCRPSSR